MRWRAYHYQNPSESTTKETFGFKTTNCPPPISELSKFEERMLKLVQNIEFRDTNSTFQKKLSQDMKKSKETTTYSFRQTKQRTTTASNPNNTNDFYTPT